MIIEKRMTEQEAHEQAVTWYRLNVRSTPDLRPPIPKDYYVNGKFEGEKAYTLMVGFDMEYLIFKPDTTNENKETNQSS